MIGASTSYYGYHGESIEGKVKKLIDIFASCNMQPYIQIGAGKNNTEYSKLVGILNKYRKENQVIFTIHQSIWLPTDNFYLNIALMHQLYILTLNLQNHFQKRTI